MWNIEEIKTKKRKVIERLKKCNDEKEKETLSTTLASYICMLENSGTIRYTNMCISIIILLYQYIINFV